MNNLPIFRFSDRELERYRRHGLAVAKIYEMAPIPLTGCVIDVSPLRQFGEPGYVWYRHDDDRSEDAPKVFVASEDYLSPPKKKITADPARHLEGVTVRLSHNIHGYEVEIELLYSDVKIQKGETAPAKT